MQNFIPCHFTHQNKSIVVLHANWIGLFSFRVSQRKYQNNCRIYTDAYFEWASSTYFIGVLSMVRESSFLPQDILQNTWWHFIIFMFIFFVYSPSWKSSFKYQSRGERSRLFFYCPILLELNIYYRNIPLNFVIFYLYKTQLEQRKDNNLDRQIDIKMSLMK